MQVKAGRNDACPCGSTKKFKRCCAPKQGLGTTSNRLLLALLLATVLGAIVAGVSSLTGERADAPPGKVWSPEHGHYH